MPQKSHPVGATFGVSILPAVTFDICRFDRFGLVPTGHRSGVLMGPHDEMTTLDSSHRQGRCDESRVVGLGDVSLELQSCGRWGQPQPSLICFTALPKRGKGENIASRFGSGYRSFTALSTSGWFIKNFRRWSANCFKLSSRPELDPVDDVPAS